MANKVLVIGSGVAGLTVASELAALGIEVEIVEKSDFPGGHAIQYTCKATDQCVKCGACMVEEKLSQAVANPNITLSTGGRLHEIVKEDRFKAIIDQKAAYIDPQKCTGCGLCRDKCPAEGAVISGFSGHQHPFFALNENNCRYIQDGSCTVCQDVCPEEAIDLDKKSTLIEIDSDAVIVATGFTPFDPISKPYGYKTFPNVVTSLELERMLRRSGRVKRPSDGTEPQRIAFIQCVGSRDAKLGHLWCSRVCCGSALRMARLVKSKKADTAIAFFYIDVQTFGKDFNRFYPLIQNDIQMVRSIPGDIYATDKDRLKVIFADSSTHQSTDETFDLVVLSVGMTPCEDADTLADRLDLTLADTGFFKKTAVEPPSSDAGVFIAGSAKGPMGIAESIADAGRVAWQTLKYIGSDKQEEM